MKWSKRQSYGESHWVIGVVVSLAMDMTRLAYAICSCKHEPAMFKEKMNLNNVRRSCRM